MATYLNDLRNNAVFAEGVAVQTVTTTTTGTYQDYVNGDGMAHCVVQVSTLTGTSVTVKVQQSTLTNSGFADITGASATVTAAGVTAFPFQRDSRYLKAYVSISGTTATVGAVLLETRKYFP